jgi:Domain of unknown function (DUF6457)
MTAREWIDAYAAALGVPAPDDARVEAVLRLAAEAAHASERLAAPVACWLAADAGLGPEEALARARGLAAP